MDQDALRWRVPKSSELGMKICRLMDQQTALRKRAYAYKQRVGASKVQYTQNGEFLFALVHPPKSDKWVKDGA